MGRRRRFTRLLALLAVSALVAAACGDDGDSGASSDESGSTTAAGDGGSLEALLAAAPAEDDDFYLPPDDLADFAPGEIIWAEEIDPIADGRVYKVLYRSESLQDEPIGVSGWIAVPDEPAEGGAPVMSWAHGTKGLADQCAPTRAGTIDEEVPFIEAFMDRGFVVVASDFEGLGTPGGHPYVIGPSLSRSVLDGARAAQGLADTGDQVFLFGHSEGSTGVLFANEQADEYAPELDVVGTVSSASGVFEADDTIADYLMGSELKGFMMMVGAANNAAYGDEGFPLEEHFTPEGIEELAALEELCVQEAIDYYAPLDGEAIFTEDAFSVPNADSLPGSEVGVGPLLMIHGIGDSTIPPPSVAPWVEAACEKGQVVDLEWFDTGHRVPYEDPEGAEARVMAWIDGLLAGEDPPSVCGDVPLPDDA